MDWKAIARARGLEIPAAELEGVAAPLESIEKAFRPLARDLPPDLEPALEFRAEEEDA
jgi:hypothetical protein